ncbi:MAG: hypothetical protein AAFQ68_18725 [Bacteroidota bacterium]
MKKNILFSTLAAILIASSVYFFSRPEPEEPPVVAQVEIPVLEVKEKLSSLRSEDWKSSYRGNLVEQIFQKAMIDNADLQKEVDQLNALEQSLLAQHQQYSEVWSFYQTFESAANDQLNQLSDTTLGEPVRLQVQNLQQNVDPKLARQRIIAINQQLQQLQDRLNLLKVESTLTYVEGAVNLAPNEEATFLALQEEVQAFLEQ